MTIEHSVKEFELKKRLITMFLVSISQRMVVFLLSCLFIVSSLFIVELLWAERLNATDLDSLRNHFLVQDFLEGAEGIGQDLRIWHRPNESFSLISPGGEIDAKSDLHGYGESLASIYKGRDGVELLRDFELFDYLILAGWYCYRSDWKRAEEITAYAETEHFDSPALWRCRAISLLRVGQVEKCIEYVDRIFDAKNTSRYLLASASNTAASAHTILGRHAFAQAYARFAIDLSKEWGWRDEESLAYGTLGSSYLFEEQYDSAIVSYNNAITVALTDGEDSAVAHLKRMFEANSQYVELHQVKDSTKLKTLIKKFEDHVIFGNRMLREQPKDSLKYKYFLAAQHDNISLSLIKYLESTSDNRLVLQPYITESEYDYGELTESIKSTVFHLNKSSYYLSASDLWSSKWFLYRRAQFLSLNGTDSLDLIDAVEIDSLKYFVPDEIIDAQIYMQFKNTTTSEDHKFFYYPSILAIKILESLKVETKHFGYRRLQLKVCELLDILRGKIDPIIYSTTGGEEIPELVKGQFVAQRIPILIDQAIVHLEMGKGLEAVRILDEASKRLNEVDDLDVLITSLAKEVESASKGNEKGSPFTDALDSARFAASSHQTLIALSPYRSKINSQLENIISLLDISY